MKTELVELESGTYEVRQVSFRVLWPIMKANQEDVGVNVLLVSVFLQGADEPVGDPILDLSFGDIKTLMDRSAGLNELDGDVEKK